MRSSFPHLSLFRRPSGRGVRSFPLSFFWYRRALPTPPPPPMWCDCGRSISQYENEIKKLREDRKILKNETKRALAEIKDKGQHLELLRSLLLASPAAAAAAKGVAGADVAGEASANGDGASSAGADILAVEALVGAEKERDQLLKETDELRV